MKRLFFILITALVFLNSFMIFKKNIQAKEQAIKKLSDNSKAINHTETIINNDELNKKIANTNSVILSRQNAITNATEIIRHSVVSVNVIKTQIKRAYTNPFQNPFFGFFDIQPYQKQEVQSIGTGVIFDENGYIITNSHVVEGATQIKVILDDGTQLDAKLIGENLIQDIAIIKVDYEKLSVAKLGNSDDLLIGEWAIAVGNPYGFFIKDSQPSVSVGVISAVNRNFAEDKNGKIYKRMIQTDAAINPGNSGGPLVNILGEVIGINTFIISESGGSVGIGFAIPINRVKKVAKEIIKYGKTRDINFGFKIQDITPRIALYYNLKSTNGVIVSYIDKNGPADKAGLKRGDIIIKINNTDIRNSDDAELAVSDATVGELITLKIIRNRKEKVISYKLMEYK